jgi:hypothetical protein
LLLEWDAGPVLVTIRQGQPDLRHVRRDLCDSI